MKNKSKISADVTFMPKQAEPVKRPISGIDHDLPPEAAICVGPGGQVEPSRYHVKLIGD